MYGLEADQVLAQDSPTGMVWSLADRLGSIDVLVDGSGAIVDQRTYDSFGNTLSQLNPNVKFRFGYTGRESDPETGLYYYRARYFDPNVGRFISTDPIGFEAGDSNIYRYVGNRSTMATDPSGEFAFIPFLAAWAVGALAVGVTSAFAGAVFGGVKDFALSAAEDYDKKQEFNFNKALDGGMNGAASGAGFGLVLGVTSTIPIFGPLAVGTAIGVGAFNTTKKAAGHFRDGQIAQGVIESLDLGFSVYSGRGPMNKALGELSKLGKSVQGMNFNGFGKSPQLAYANGNSGMMGGAFAIPQTPRPTGGGLAGQDVSDLFKPFFEMAKQDGKSSPLSQPGGLTATEGLTVAKKPTHPLSKHGPDVPVQNLKNRVISEYIPKSWTGIISKFNNRASMEASIRIMLDRNKSDINTWLASNQTQPLKLRGNPGLGNLGTGFQARYTASGNYPVLYGGSLERVSIDLVKNNSGGYVIQTAMPIR